MAMTPTEEAGYALDNRLDRDGLPEEVRAEYDRLLQQRHFAAARGEIQDPDGGSHAQPAASSGPGPGRYISGYDKDNNPVYAARPAVAPLLPGKTALPERRQEDLALAYARQTRNAAVFIAWVVGIVMVLALIGVIVTGVELAHLSNAINGGGGGSCVPGVTC